MSKCLRCGRKITKPESIRRGYGSFCIKIIMDSIELSKQKPLIDVYNKTQEEK